MTLFQQLTEAVEKARGAAAKSENEEQAWAGRLSEQLASYLNAPSEAIRYTSSEGEIMVHVGFPQLRDEDGWHGFHLEIATDPQKRHRFRLHILLQKASDHYRTKLGASGEVFALPSQRDDFFDHVFVILLADLQTNEGRDTARKGGVRSIG